MRRGNMVVIAVKFGGLILTVACWAWAQKAQRSDAWNMAMIWCAPLFAYPITLLGRKALDKQPVIRRCPRLRP